MRFDLVMARDFSAGGETSTVKAGTTIGQLVFLDNTPANMRSARFIADAIRGGALVHAREVEEEVAPSPPKKDKQYEEKPVLTMGGGVVDE